MKKEVAIYVWRAMFIVSFLSFFLWQVDTITEKQKKRRNVSSAHDLHTTLQWLRENSEEDAVVLTPWIYGAQVATFARRPTIATSKVYPSEVKEVAERYTDINKKFLGARNRQRALEIVNKYGVKYILIRKKRKKGKRLLHALYKGKDLKDYKCVYESCRYLIYKVKDTVCQESKTVVR